MTSRRVLRYLWAAPVSAAALTLVPLVLASGGRARMVDGVLEVGGGILGPLLTRAAPSFPIGAISLGHVVLGTDERVLAASREHERAHVRQYERWGVLLPPMYLLSSLAALLRGGHVYSDNAFERAACREADEMDAA